MQTERYCECGCGGRTGRYKVTDPRSGAVKGEYRRFIGNHHLRKYRVKPVRWVEEDRGHETPCWIWQLALNRKGYASTFRTTAYRMVYEEFRGTVPTGLQLDHLCRVPACVNPDHLEPVTGTENVRRGNSVKLDVEKARQIKALLREGGRTQREIGELFGVGPGTICAIKGDKLWKDVA